MGSQNVGHAESRLFERLGLPERTMPLCAHERQAVTIDSIKRHLVELLNSRPGCCECAPALGLLDFNDATIGILDLELSIQQAIRSCIERFEPRISHVLVESLPDRDNPLQLRFQVQATLALEDEQPQTTIDLLLNDKRYHCLN